MNEHAVHRYRNEPVSGGGGGGTSGILAHSLMAANAGNLTVPHTTTVPFPTITNDGFTIASAGQVTMLSDGYLQVNMMVVNAGAEPLYNWFGLARVGDVKSLFKSSELTTDNALRYYHLNTVIPVLTGEVYEIRAYVGPDSAVDITVNGFADPVFSTYDSNVTWTLFA